MQLLHDALVYRIQRLQDAIPDNAPILYKSGAFKINSLQKILSIHYLQNNAQRFQWGISVYTKRQHYFMDRIGNTILKLKHSHSDILREMKRYQVEWTKQYDIWFSIYSTPSESLTDRFCRLDKEKFGFIPDVTDKGYYQNSFHYDVRKDVTPFEKLDFEKTILTMQVVDSFIIVNIQS